MKRMVLGILIFGSGMLAGRWLTPAQAPWLRAAGPDLNAVATSCSPNSARQAPTQALQPVASATSSSSAGSGSDGFQAERTAARAVERPRSDHPILSAEQEEKLASLVDATSPALEKVTQKKFPDGSVDVYGKSADGANVFEHFNPAGELAKESMNYPSGEGVYRNFYNSGGIKSLSWNRTDQGSTSISFGESGYYETRYDRAPDQTTTSTTYDDTGQAKDVWHVGKDGKYVREN